LEIGNIGELEKRPSLNLGMKISVFCRNKISNSTLLTVFLWTLHFRVMAVFGDGEAALKGLPIEFREFENCHLIINYWNCYHLSLC